MFFVNEFVSSLPYQSSLFVFYLLFSSVQSAGLFSLFIIVCYIFFVVSVLSAEIDWSSYRFSLCWVVSSPVPTNFGLKHGFCVF